MAYAQNTFANPLANIARVKGLGPGGSAVTLPIESFDPSIGTDPSQPYFKFGPGYTSAGFDVFESYPNLSNFFGSPQYFRAPIETLNRAVSGVRSQLDEGPVGGRAAASLGGASTGLARFGNTLMRGQAGNRNLNESVLRGERADATRALVAAEPARQAQLLGLYRALTGTEGKLVGRQLDLSTGLKELGLDYRRKLRAKRKETLGSVPVFGGILSNFL